MARQRARHPARRARPAPLAHRARPPRSAPARCGSGADGPSARQARASWSPRRRRAGRRRGSALRLARRAQARATRSTRSGIDVDGPRLPRRRRLDRRLHRLPAAARRRPRDRARRRPRPARLARCGTTPASTVIERVNARDLRPADLSVRARAGHDRRLVHLARQGAAGASPRCLAPEGELLALVKPQFELGRGRVGKGGVVRDPRRSPRGAPRGGARGRARSGSAVRGLRVVGPAGPEGQPRDLRLVCRDGEGSRTSRPPSRRSSRERRPRRRAAIAHRRAASPTRPRRTRGGAAAAVRGRSGGALRAGRHLDEAEPSTATRAGEARGRRRAARRARPLPRAGRRRHDPARAAPLRRHGGPGLRDQLRARSASWRPSSATSSTRASSAPSRGDFEVMRAAGARDRRGGPRPVASTTSPSRALPHGRGRRARLPARRRGGRSRALRRPRRRHAGGLDGLQPRQRRADPRLGGGGLRGQLHRPAHAHGARPGGRRPTTCSRCATSASASRSTSRSTASTSGELERRRRGRGAASATGSARLAQLPGANFYHRMREKFGALALA